MSQRFKLLFLASSFFISLTRLTVGMDGEGQLPMSNPSARGAKYKLSLIPSSFSSPGISPVPAASPLCEGDHPGFTIPWPHSQPSSQILSSQDTLGSPLSRQVSHLSHESGDDLGGVANAENGALDQPEDETPEPEEVSIQEHPNRRGLSRLNPKAVAITEDDTPQTE